jgi:hypothetical protein
MRTSDSLLAELKAAGFTLTVEGERLRVRPADLLTDALRSAIREHRDALHALVASENTEVRDRAKGVLTARVPSVSKPKLHERVCCGECQRFTPDPVGFGGIGTCDRTGTGLAAERPTFEPPCYPMTPRRCSSFLALEGREE